MIKLVTFRLQLRRLGRMSPKPVQTTFGGRRSRANSIVSVSPPGRRRQGSVDSAGRLHGQEDLDHRLLSPLSALLGALIGGSAPVVAAIYTQRSQNRDQRIAAEAAKREAVYADFVASASTLILNAYTHDDITLGGEQQRIIGLINRMRLFAPPGVVKGAEAVVRTIVDISLKPSVELRQLAKESLSRSLDPDPLLTFSVICRADLDDLLRTAA